MFDWIDARVQEILVTVGMGAALGTLWRMVLRPESEIQRFLVKAVVALTVGIVVGGGVVEYLKLSGFQAAGVGSVAALLSEEVLAFLRVRGKKLQQGKIDTTLSGDDDE